MHILRDIFVYKNINTCNTFLSFFFICTNGIIPYTLLCTLVFVLNSIVLEVCSCGRSLNFLHLAVFITKLFRLKEKELQWLG